MADNSKLTAAEMSAAVESGVAAGFKSGGGLAVVIGMLHQSVSKFHTLQQRSFKLNLDLKSFISKNSEILKGLPGGIYANIGPALEAREAGISSLNRGTLKLIAAMQTTGEWNQGVGIALAGLEFATSKSSLDMANLATGIREATDSQRITMGKLIEGLSRLQSKLQVFTLGGGKVDEAIMAYVNANNLSRQSFEALTRSLDYRLGPEAFAQNIAGGFGPILDKLSRVTDPEQGSKLIDQLVRREAGLAKRFNLDKQTGTMVAFLTKQFEGVVGPMIGGLRIQKEIQAGQDKAAGGYTRFFRTVDNIWSQLKGPMFEQLANILDSTIRLFGQGGPLNGALSAIADFLPWVAGFIGAKWLWSGAKTLFRFFGKGGLWGVAIYSLIKGLDKWTSLGTMVRTFIKETIQSLRSISSIYLQTGGGMFEHMAKWFLDATKKDDEMKIKKVEVDTLTTKESLDLFKGQDQTIINDALQHIIFSLPTHSADMLNSLAKIEKATTNSAISNSKIAKKKSVTPSLGNFD